MAQLIMNWKNDGTAPIAPSFPEGISLKRLTDLSDGPAQWLDIIRFMEQTEKAEVPYEVFEKSLLKHLDFDENLCFFLAVKGEIAATVTVICHREQRQGYIHMVACKPHFRGMGLGREIMDWMEKEYPRVRRFRLEVTQVNKSAIRLYEKSGYKYLRYDQMVFDK